MLPTFTGSGVRVILPLIWLTLASIWLLVGVVIADMIST
jgi:hypothetical protein